MNYEIRESLVHQLITDAKRRGITATDQLEEILAAHYSGREVVRSSA